MIDLLIVRMIGWFIYLLIDSLNDRIIEWYIAWKIYGLPDWLIDPIIDWLIWWIMYLLIVLMIDLCINWFIDWIPRECHQSRVAWKEGSLFMKDASLFCEEVSKMNAWWQLSTQLKVRVGGRRRKGERLIKK